MRLLPRRSRRSLQVHGSERGGAQLPAGRQREERDRGAAGGRARRRDEEGREAVRRLKAVWSRVRSTKGLGRDVGIFAEIVVLGLGVAGYILANQRVIWPWDERVTYVAEFSEAPGVVAGQGQEVRIAGV